ncbi:hypothetical protein GF325_01005 [Candidatus Bathyarchaeota archaeon]|nr:hypothetical protein [Candidatus Bathyarchaeota archaeon]
MMEDSSPGIPPSTGTLDPVEDPTAPVPKPGTHLDYWKVISIARPIASFWYNYIFLLLAAIPALLMYSWLLPSVILPFPSAIGFQALTVNFFGLFFSIMDVATGPACERFVSQHAEINPDRAMKYVQFFIWFQMITGLAQVTIVTLFCLLYVVHTNLGYAMWFFLTYSLTQFPGMLSAFKSTLRGFQRFDKSNIVELLQTTVFETTTQIVFIMVGRWVGAMNPKVGELFGATIGYIIGKYIDDFFAMMLAARYVSKIIKPYGLKLRQAIIPRFGLDIAKESLLYGVKLLGSTVISALTEYLTLLMMVLWLPNYVFIIGIVELARGIAGLVGAKYNYAPLISESYNNGKKNLAKYAITQYWNSWWILGFYLSIVITILIPTVFEKLGGNFAFTATIIPIYILPRLLITPAGMGADVCQAVDKPGFRTWGIVSEKVTKMITVFVFLSPWGLRNIFGETSLLTLYILHDIPAYIVITFVEFGLVHRYAIKVKINIWQTFVAGSLSSTPIIPVAFLLVKTFNITWELGNTVVPAIAFIVVALFLVLFVFPVVIFFMYGFLGGLDSRSLVHYQNAVTLCGPSRFLVRFFFSGARIGFKLSPIKDRFRTPWEEADREAMELMAMRHPEQVGTHHDGE